MVVTHPMLQTKEDFAFVVVNCPTLRPVDTFKQAAQDPSGYICLCLTFHAYIMSVFYVLLYYSYYISLIPPLLEAMLRQLIYHSIFYIDCK